LASLNIPSDVTTKVNNLDSFGISEIQRLEDAAGAVVNMDEFGVSMDVSDIPYGMSPEGFLRRIRSNLNQFTDDPDIRFNVVDGSMHSEPLGTVVSITLEEKWFINVDEGSVVVSSTSDSHWTLRWISPSKRKPKVWIQKKRRSYYFLHTRS